MRRILVLSALFTSLVGCATAKVAEPTQDELMHNMKAAGEVTEHHEILSRLAGSWKVETKMWMNPHSAPEISTGSAKNSLLFGGRYLSQDYKGSYLGQPLEGKGIIGFDNMNQKYFSTWIDSANTSMMRSEGVSRGDDSIALSSLTMCPMTRELVEGEEILTLVDENKFRWDVFQNKDGDRVRVMEILYSRVR